MIYDPFRKIKPGLVRLIVQSENLLYTVNVSYQGTLVIILVALFFIVASLCSSSVGSL